MAKLPHNFRVGDVVVRCDRKGGKFVICGTRGWIHDQFTHEDGRRDARVSLAKEIGSVPLLSNASEYKIFMLRENTPKKWWTIFTKGEK